MNETISLAPTTLAVAIVAGLIASAMTTMNVRGYRSGRVIPAHIRLLPGALYFADVAPEHKRRRAALDVTTVVGAITASLWLTWAWVPFAFVWAALVAGSATDLRIMRLPERMTYLNIVASIAFAAVFTTGVAHTLGAVGAGLLFALMFFTMGIILKGKLGFGDVVLALGCGTLAGAFWGLWGFPLALIGTGTVSVLALVQFAPKGRRGAAIPFGPYIASGSLLTAILGAVTVHVTGTYPADPGYWIAP